MVSVKGIVISKHSTKKLADSKAKRIRSSKVIKLSSTSRSLSNRINSYARKSKRNTYRKKTRY
jgi:hypothetical protein